MINCVLRVLLANGSRKYAARRARAKVPPRDCRQGAGAYEFSECVAFVAYCFRSITYLLRIFIQMAIVQLHSARPRVLDI